MENYNSIIQGVRKKDMKSQMSFYDLFFRPVYQSAFAVLGNQEEAEEIMHDTLLKVFSNPDLLHDESGAMTRMLKRIATNQAIDAVRKRRDFFIPLDDDGSMDMEEEEENEAEREWSVSEIKSGISQLSLAYRNIIVLRLFEEMSFSEISEQLDVNASTVRVQYARGISKLRTLLKQQKYEQ